MFSLLIIILSFTKYADYDLWWHLELGQTVYNSHEIYSEDEFSYTFQGKKQFNAEWLADLIIFLFFKIGGFWGINIFKSLVLLITFYFLFKTFKDMNGDNQIRFYALLVTLITILYSIRFRLFVRPYLFSFMFIAIFLFIINRFDRKREYSIFYPLLFLEIIWANMSVGAVFGVVFLLFYVIGEFTKAKFNFKLLAILAGLVLFSLLNPEIYKIYSLVFNLAGDPYSSSVGEYQPVSAQLLWGYGLRYTLPYQILVAGSVFYFIFMEGWKNIFHLLLFLVFFMESLLQIRMIEFFSLVAGVFFINPVEKLLQIIIPEKYNRKALIDFAAVFIILILILLSIGSKTYAFGYGIKEDAFPDDAINFIEKEGIKGRMFNSYSFGGYLIWKSHERKVFFDGRYRRLYNPEFYKEYSNIIKNADAWEQAERRWGFDYAVMEYDLKDRRFPLHLNSNPDWALIYWDNHSAVYLKRTRQNKEITEKYEYKIAKPNFYDFSYLEVYLHSKTALNAVEQLNKEINYNPFNQEPRLAKVFLLFNLGSAYHDEALRELNISLQLKPDIAAEHSAVAFIFLEKGLKQKAKNEINKALHIDRNDPGAQYLGKILGI